MWDSLWWSKLWLLTLSYPVSGRDKCLVCGYLYEVDCEELSLYLPRAILCLKETSSWLAATCPPGISPSESLPSVSYSEIGRCRVKIFLTSESVLPRLSDSETTWVGIRTCPTHFSLEFQLRRLGEVKVNVGEFRKVTCFSWYDEVVAVPHAGRKTMPFSYVQNAQKHNVEKDFWRGSGWI